MNGWEVTVELLKGLGYMLIHPLFYLGFLFTLYLGYIRVKRERKNFKIRVQNGWFDLRQYIKSGWLFGILASIFLFIAWTMLPLSFIIVSTIVTVLFSLILKPSFLSPAYTLGTSFIVFILCGQLGYEFSFLPGEFSDFNTVHIPAMALLITTLLILEGLLIIYKGSKHTSPKIIQSKRGLKVGVHESKRLWLIPLILMVPNGSFSLVLDFWPLHTQVSDSFSLLLIPFWIGFGQQITMTRPDLGVRITGRRVLALGIAGIIFAIAGLWVPILSYISVGLILLGRLAIPIIQRIQNNSAPFYFSKTEPGIVILDIIPESPADKMDLKIGEIIHKVNGIIVHDEQEYYEALQVNRAFCKLEVFDENNEKRLVNRALYEGEHHELGVLFVGTKRQWEQDAV